jgi:hypothetical protein
MNLVHSGNDTSIIILLVVLLIVTNFKPIVLYNEWFHFKIRTILKQYLNGRKNKTNYRL